MCSLLQCDQQNAGLRANSHIFFCNQDSAYFMILRYLGRNDFGRCSPIFVSESSASEWLILTSG